MEKSNLSMDEIQTRSEINNSNPLHFLFLASICLSAKDVLDLHIHLYTYILVVWLLDAGVWDAFGISVSDKTHEGGWSHVTSSFVKYIYLLNSPDWRINKRFCKYYTNLILKYSYYYYYYQTCHHHDSLFCKRKFTSQFNFYFSF